MTVDAPLAARSRRSGAKRRPPRTPLLLLRDVVVIVVIAVLVSAGIKAFLVRAFYIPSGSMENTLQINDRILVNELEPRLIPLSHGDVIVFRDPGGWLPASPAPAQNPVAAALEFTGLLPSNSDDHLIKRVIGLPGDTVVCCNTLGQLSVNGVPLDESKYVKLPVGTTRVSAADFSVTVPKDGLWVMGDNRNNSRDSRFNLETPSKGFVPISDVVGRAFVVTWPVARWAWLDSYQ